MYCVIGILLSVLSSTDSSCLRAGKYDQRLSEEKHFDWLEACYLTVAEYLGI
jgi:hypothetical protein